MIEYLKIRWLQGKTAKSILKFVAMKFGSVRHALGLATLSRDLFSIKGP